MAETVISSITGKVVDLLCGVAKREISYVCNCSENVEKYKNEADKLSSMKGRVQQHIDLAKSKGEDLLEGVEEWMKKADDYTSNATQFTNGGEDQEKRFNLCTLRRCSKTAIKKTLSLRQHQEDGKSFETCVSLPAQAPGFTDLYQSKNLEDIHTQKLTLKKIIGAIEDDTTQIVGINGLGGVGKTTLASEVAKAIKNQFADIVFIAVSRTVDAKMIQEKVKVPASRIIKGEKVLIILDDVWEELKLQDLGIPCVSEHMNCKILLTSRSIEVCAAMNVQKNISVNPLQEEEAWTLFERVVGKSEWHDKLKEVALKIVKECGGLPLFIQALGKALKDKEIKIWKATLRRLHAPMDGDVIYKKEGILQLKLSYDHLEDDVAKSLFLLCSMFPEDGNIGLKKLTHYGLALGIFNNPDSIHDTKDIVQLVVESLKSSFLLLPADDFSFFEDNRREEEELFKMHDLVRDMALFVTFKGDDKFLVKSGKGLREWQPRSDVIKSYKKISLMENKICKLPDYELDLPYLDTFLIRNNELSIVPDEFFRGMKELKVLDMLGNNFSSLPQSLTQLTMLRLLDLSDNMSLCEISLLGGLSCLEILKLRRTGIRKIPEEIGRLTNLRLLDVYYCYDLSYVTPGVISKLIMLEELYISLMRGDCSFLTELSELALLKILHLRVWELRYIPKIETLIEFDIGTSEQARFEHTWGLYKRCLEVSEYRCSLTMPIRKLIQLSEVLTLSYIEDLDNILPDLYQEGFDELRHIVLRRCGNVRSLVKTCDLDGIQTSNESGPMKTKGKFFSHVEVIHLDHLDRLELLWDNPHQYISFCNLVEILIYNSSSLLKLFPISVAQGLVNLKDLTISNCKSLVNVISDGDEQTTGSETELVKKDTNIVFSFDRIRLYNLPKLESFYSGHSIIKYPSLEDIRVHDCPSMKRWSYGENRTTKIKFYDEERECSINDYIAGIHEKNGNFTYKGVAYAF
ncbi:putative P-loop containing nucleoside triphosphate hydrolase, leucine-rich repeat domain superfamily [Helianthus annuus]|uniref:P-loop containing nucleoside triphosphate hydrolase, leucine-rich repeat domain superfamily n=1 Tax=Helianthus annuus TaxID=4232 RepID=A0A9K3NDT7_HELAN|nr:probable disease resistance protein At4g27220 isoform X1 [Helianthus annuus]KAF5796100.1 putative P-loop containing nucleoside triphosphate hydrolase, leucine-rich repeat domain superfamily [Helianthus annuus]KAJ0547676.1 putative P-loop containing nucleoside triphosphate hydrolase, leucine-rich repeat domain superfamily [Helianthus annuus]KAJ0902327.1 putative P-loop containing nucleoside triphosphate hydrolase, leucine-rich repeat domain superfamily [Helianthus annuus]